VKEVPIGFLHPLQDLIIILVGELAGGAPYEYGRQSAWERHPFIKPKMDSFFFFFNLISKQTKPDKPP